MNPPLCWPLPEPPRFEPVAVNALYAIIKPYKLNAAIEDAENELYSYAEGSGEYQIVKGDIERLTAFKARLIDSVEV